MSEFEFKVGKFWRKAAILFVLISILLYVIVNMCWSLDTDLRIHDLEIKVSMLNQLLEKK